MTKDTKLLQHSLGAIALLLLVPAVAMLFTDQVNWTAIDFLVMGILLLGTAAAYIFGIRKLRKPDYRAALTVVLVLVFLLIWAEMAVGIFGTPLAGD